MRFTAVFLLAAVSLSAATRAQVEAELDRLAQVATAMVDGDECQRIMTPRALDKMFRTDPRDRWAGHDNFDVNDGPYIAVKKVLRRVSTLAPFPVDCNLWMGFRERPELVQILIRQVNEMSQFWKWGDLYQPMPPEMKEVLQTGKRKTVAMHGDYISVLTPVFNSLGDPVAIVEVVARLSRDERGNVK
ncbi:MAG TPA: hypothetical protein VEU62_21350 [Bryobacterales bacterium]|nr:hypothetical protein [Bryobacterales bacterium]